MADAFTAPLRASSSWVPCDASLEADEISEAIYKWCNEEGGMPAPLDSEIHASLYEIPAGSSWDGWPQHPARVRVTLPNGVRYVLNVEIDGGYGDDGTGWKMFFAVEVRHGN